MSYGDHDFETTNYNAPGLAYDTIAGVSAPGAPNPLFIPMNLTTYQGANTKSRITTEPLIPFMQPGLSYGGQVLLAGTKDLPKITLEGYIDTPCTVSGTNNIASVQINSQPAHWPEVIALCFEGRAVTPRQVINPRWFRDPYGRIFGDYNNDGTKTRPVIIDFSATYIEAAPQRMNFQMVLKV